MQKHILIIFVLVWCSGCTSTYLAIPLSRFESAETMGSLQKLHFKLGYQRTDDVTFATDASSRPLTLAGPGLDVEPDFFAQLSYELIERLDFDLRGSALQNTPYTLGVKFQFLGDQRETAKAGNFSASLMGNFGASWSYRGGSQNGLFGRGGYGWDSYVNTTSQDFALIIGYRLTDHHLFYGSGFYGMYYGSGSIHQKASDDGTSPAAQSSFGGSGIISGWSAALQTDLGENVHQSAYFTVEVTHSNLVWFSQATQTIEAWSLNGLLGFRL